MFPASSAAANVRSPIPVAAASRHDSTADAHATPMLVPKTRIRFSSPPASLARSLGAALNVALLLGAMNSRARRRTPPARS
jgi:hypothetical protein